MYIYVHIFSRWMWGWNKYGQIGVGSLDNVLNPIQVHLPGGIDLRTKHLKGIQLGYKHTVVVTSDMKLFGWGSISFNIPSDDNIESSFSIKSFIKPTEIKIPYGLLPGPIVSLSGSSCTTVSFLSLDVEISDPSSNGYYDTNEQQPSLTSSLSSPVVVNIRREGENTSVEAKKIEVVKKTTTRFNNTIESVRSPKVKTEFKSIIGKSPMNSPTLTVADPWEVKDRLRKLLLSTSTSSTRPTQQLAMKPPPPLITHKSKWKSIRSKSPPVPIILNNNTKPDENHSNVIVESKSEWNIAAQKHHHPTPVFTVPTADVNDSFTSEELSDPIDNNHDYGSPLIDQEVSKKVCRFDRFERESFVDLFSPSLLNTIRTRRSSQKQIDIEAEKTTKDETLYGVEMPISEKVFRNTFNLLNRQDPATKSIARTKSLQQDDDLLLLVTKPSMPSVVVDQSFTNTSINNSNNNHSNINNNSNNNISRIRSFDELSVSINLSDSDTIDKHLLVPRDRLLRQHLVAPVASSYRSGIPRMDNQQLLRDFSTKRLSSSLYNSPNNCYNSIYRASKHSHQQKLHDLAAHLDSAIASLRSDIDSNIT